MTAAAARVGDLMVAHRLGVDTTWKSATSATADADDRMEAGV